MSVPAGYRFPGGLLVGEQGLGCMGMSEFYGRCDEDESLSTTREALDSGVSMLDTSDMYGVGTNEALIGRALTGRRDHAVVATKFGVLRSPSGPLDDYRPLGIGGDRAYVHQAIEASLTRLRTDRVDLYYLHRVDPTVPIEETVAAMGELVTAGKVRHLGLSEVSGDQLRRAHAIHPISAVQLEWSLWTRDRVRRHVGSASTRHRHRRLLTPRPRTGHRHASCTGEPRTHRPAARVRALVDGERRAQPRDRRPPRRHREGTRPRLGAARPRLGCG